MDLTFLTKNSNYNFKSYFDRYNDFFVNNYSELVSYWKNFDTQIDFKILKEFEYLRNEYDNLVLAFEQILNKEADNIDLFIFVEFLSDVKMNLDYVENLPKWLKTSDNFVDVFEEPYVEYVVQQNDTLEIISRKFYGDSEQFHFIMKYNNLTYSDVGSSNWIGRQIKIPARKKLLNDINGIIDALVGDKILGKDINKTFAFSDNDISNVEGEDCFSQAIQILIQEMPKGSIPEHPKVGSNINSIIGHNLGDLSLPMLKNDLESMKRYEPTLKELIINNIKFVDDKIEIDFSFESILGYKFLDNQIINKSVN